MRPLFTELIPIAEDLDKQSLASAAKSLGPAAEAVVAKYAWNPNAKSALVTSASAVSAKWLNKSGVSAENAPEVSLGIACLSIYWGHTLIARELKKLAEEKRIEDKSGKVTPNAGGTHN